MKNEVLVIVFPSIFSKNKVSSLISNIKKVLKIQNQKFRKIRKEGDDKRYYESGKLKSVANYIDGLKQGEEKIKL